MEWHSMPLADEKLKTKLQKRNFILCKIIVIGCFYMNLDKYNEAVSKVHVKHGIHGLDGKTRIFIFVIT